MAAALVALFAWIFIAASSDSAWGAGIECGWQPMPDSSASYECVVQVDRDLLSALQRGDSIPLTVDIPEHIRPVSRIRFISGNVELPRETLAANLKTLPTEEKKSRDGVVETQYTTTNQQPTNGAVVPLNNYMSNAQDAFARQLQNGGQAIQNAVGQATQDILPPSSVQSVTNSIDRAGNELSNNIRSASDNVREDIRQLFGDESTSAGSAEILPPGGQKPLVSSIPQSQPIYSADLNSSANGTKRLDQPIPSNAGYNWQSTQPGGPNGSNPNIQPSSSAGQYVGVSPPATPPLAANTVAAPPLTGASAAVLPQNSGITPTTPTDRYGNVGLPQQPNISSADVRNIAASNTQGPSFPSFTPSLGNEQSPVTPTPMTASSTPEIRRDMFNQPANAEIQGANGLPIGQQPISNAQVASQTPQTSAPNDFGWNTKPQPSQTVATQMAGPAGATKSVLPLVLSWVLLGGSFTGNLFLFWSYLDVRNKYRDLVDDAARRISGRRARD